MLCGYKAMPLNWKLIVRVPDAPSYSGPFVSDCDKQVGRSVKSVNYLTSDILDNFAFLK